MASLLVLLDQVNAFAPARGRASDGLKASAAHHAASPNSDHEPHFVAGVGAEIVTALDLTHDPAHGFDSYAFAEVLRTHRDRRIKYVISNHRIFSSYSNSKRPAWTWGVYTGSSDPHTGHVHVSVLDAQVCDTRTPWTLEGLMAEYTVAEMRAMPWQYDGRGIGENNGTTVRRSTLSYFDEMLQLVRKIAEQVNIDPEELEAIEQAAHAGAAQAVTPEAIAAAIPDDIAVAVVDLLGQRIAQATRPVAAGTAEA
jgi:hypothetical protein